MRYSFPFGVYGRYQEAVDKLNEIRSLSSSRDVFSRPKEYQSRSSYVNTYGENALKIFENIDFIQGIFDEQPHDQRFITTNLRKNTMYPLADGKGYVRFGIVIEKDQNLMVGLTFKQGDFRLEPKPISIELMRFKNTRNSSSKETNKDISILMGLTKDTDHNDISEYLKFLEIETEKDVIDNYDKLTIKSILEWYLSEMKDELFFIDGKMQKRDFSSIKREYNIE